MIGTVAGQGYLFYQNNPNEVIVSEEEDVNCSVPEGGCSYRTETCLCQAPCGRAPTLMQAHAQEAQWGEEWPPRHSQGSPLRQKSAEPPCEVWPGGQVVCVLVSQRMNVALPKVT